MFSTTPFIITLLYISFAYNSYANEMEFESLQELPGRHTFSVLKDSYGFIWIGCEGIIRYDSYEMRYYNEKNNTLLYKGITCEVLFEDSKHNIWAGGIHGLSRYNRDKDIFVYYDSTKISSTVQIKFTRSVVEDKQGNIWVNSSHGIFKYNKAEDKFDNIPLIDKSGNTIYSTTTLCIDKYGVMWIGTNFGTIYKYNTFNNNLTQYKTGIFASTNNYNNTPISCIYQDTRGNIWITGSGIAMYIDAVTNRQINLTEKYEELNTVNCITEDSAGNIWIGASTVFIFNYTNNSLTKLNKEKNKIQSNSVQSIYIDNEGIIWISGWNTGINYYNPKKKPFKSFKSIPFNTNSLTGSYIYDFYEDKTGKIWICSEGVNIFNPQTESFKAYRAAPDNPDKLYNETLLSMCEGDENELFIGAFGALHKMDMTTGKVERYFHDSTNYNSLSGNNIYGLVKGDNNNIWIGITNSQWGGLDEMDLTTGKITHHSMLSSDECTKHTNPSVVDIYKDTKGNIWVLAWHELYKYDIKNRCFELYIHNIENPYINNPEAKYNISPGRVYCCYQDSKQRLWIGTGSGINIYNYTTGKFLNFGHNHGMEGYSVRAIQEDNNGNLWLATECGLSKFILPSQVFTINEDSAYYDSITPNFNYFNNYNKHDGLPENEYLNATLRSRNGNLYFGGTNGFICFNPNKIERHKNSSVVRFTNFSLFNKPVRSKSKEYTDSPLEKDISVTKSITLTHKQNVFSIEWSGFNYTSTAKCQYAYKLEGFNNKWNIVGTKRSATYTNLSPGKYTFKVKSCNNDNNWNENYSSLDIYILPPWWKTWLFKTITLFIAILIAALILKLRERSLKERQKKLEAKIKLHTSALSEANMQLEEQYRKVEKQKNEIIRISEELHKADEAKLKFFTNISHEFRTPITLIMGHLEKLTSSVENQSVRIIRNSSQQLLDMINQLIDIRKIDQGHLPLNISKFDIVGYIKHIVENFKVIAQQKNINLQLHTNIEKLNILLDSEKLRYILNNLISNSIKYTPENKNIIVNIYQHNSECIIEVDDEGIGISEEVLPHIFERFYRGNNVAYHGHGIGLNYVKQLVELQKGIISVQSTQGKGTCFIVQFKTGNTNFNESEIKPTSSAIQSTKTVKKTTTVNNISLNSYEILLVEDNYELADYISSLLCSIYKIRRAHNGKDALEKLAQKIPDLIISDIMMPIMDGMELCRIIKSKIEYSHIPVILLTAKYNINTQIEGFTHGIDDFITKPFRSELLMARINALLTNREILKKQFQTNKSYSSFNGSVISESDKIFWNNFIGIIKKNYTNTDFKAEHISKMMNMCNTAFYNKFKSLTGLGVADFLRNYRIHKAAELLNENELAVKQISYQVGIKSLSQFRIIFKEKFGKTPSEYINEN